MGNRWGNSGNSVRLYFGGLQKSLQMVIAAMKLKDAYSLGGKLWKWSHSVVSDSLQPMDCSLLSSSVHGILQARMLEWVAISFSRGSSLPRDRTQVYYIAGRRFNLHTTREALMTNLDSILKSRDITLSTKVHLVKAMVFPVDMYGCETWILKRAECRRIGAF